MTYIASGGALNSTHPRSIVNTVSSTASLLMVDRDVLGLRLAEFLVIDPVCVKRLLKSFNILFFYPLARNSFISLMHHDIAKYK